MGNHTFMGEYDTTEAELKSKFPFIVSASVTPERTILVFDIKDRPAVKSFLQSKRIKEKQKYANATDQEKQNMLAKKVGLI